jgi:hypothetical protein
VAARSKAWVCGRSLAGIAGSNRAGGMDVCLLWVLCVVRYWSPRRADHSSRGVLPSVVCLTVWSWSLDSEEALAHWGLLRHSKNNIGTTGVRADRLVTWLPDEQPSAADSIAGRAVYLSHPQNFHTCCRAHMTWYSMDTGVKRPGREASHFPSNSKVRNYRHCTFTPLSVFVASIETSYVGAPSEGRKDATLLSKSVKGKNWLYIWV